MGTVPPLLMYLLLDVSGWVYRHQLIAIEFLQAENSLLKQRLRGKRIRFTDAKRALLARKRRSSDGASETWQLGQANGTYRYVRGSGFCHVS